MTISNQIILILSALGSINGVFVALYLVSIKPKVLAHKFLAAMILMISIRTLKSVLFYFNPEITKTILQIGLSACFLIGPLFYFFCCSHLNRLNGHLISWKIQLLSLIIIVMLVGILFPYVEHEALWGDVFYKVVNYVWLFYIVLSIVVIFPNIKVILRKQKMVQDDLWLLVIFCGNIFIWFAYFTASYTSYIVGALSFSFILLIICVLLYFRMNDRTENTKYADKKIDDTDAFETLQRLNILMNREELYKNSLISMPKIAKRLGMSTPKFSQLLNDNLNKSFSIFINEYRIEAAKELLSIDNPPNMDEISEQCGFNSSSTFYSAFKKVTSSTPAKYRSTISPKL
jgi:AraC-like DNA-binding protein